MGPQSIPGTPGTVSNPQVFTGIGDCRAVKPGYDIPYSQYAASFKGLPGMSGGKRRKSRKGSKGKKTRKQRGGRYGFFPEGIGSVTPSGAAWWAGTYAPIQRIACEGSTPNPLNPGPHTPSTQPLPVASSRIPMPQTGGAQLAPATYGVGNVDSMYYYAPTAGYANTASTWKDSVGAPVQIQVPFAARAMNQACLTTGGPPPLTGALQKGGRRTRKQQRGGMGILNRAKNALRSVPLLGQLVGPAPPKNLGAIGNAYASLSESAPTTNSTASTQISTQHSAIESFAVNGNVGAASPVDVEPASTALPASPVGSNSSNSNSNLNSNSYGTPKSMAPPPAPANNPEGLVVGGKGKKKHHKKRSHKRRH